MDKPILKTIHLRSFSGPGYATPKGDQLNRGEIHLWSVQFCQSPDALVGVQSLLSKDESRRAGRFAKEEDRLRFVGCRGLLRTLIGMYCNADPKAIHFNYGLHGKPQMQHSTRDGELHFNLSHSGAMAVFCFSRSYELGIDIELHRRVPSEELAHLILSPQELQQLRAMPQHGRSEALLRAWVRREAIAKGLGTGLSLDLSCISFDGFEAIDSDPVPIRSQNQLFEDWQLYDLFLDCEEPSVSALSIRLLDEKLPFCSTSNAYLNEQSLVHALCPQG